MKKIICLLLSGICVVSLAACGTAPATSSKADAPASVVSSSDISQPQAAPQEKATLYIGVGEEGVKEVPCDAEKTPEALISALEKETGWKLSVASITENLLGNNCLTVAFAADSAIYTEPPEPQKDAYHVYDAEDWVYTVLNSVERTLTKNLELEGVAFASPEGGNITSTNEFIKFHFSSKVLWHYNPAYNANQPLPEDSIGLIYLYPLAIAEEKETYSLGGMDILNILFMRPDVKPGTGKLTVYNEDGSVFDTVTADKMVAKPATPDMLEYTHLTSGTSIDIFLNKSPELGKTYLVDFDAGTFVCGKISNKELSKDSWKIIIADYGVASDTFPSGRIKTVKVGQNIAFNMKLSDSITKCIATVSDPAMATIDTATLTADGVITVTPIKAGEFTFSIEYLHSDGTSIVSYEFVTVVA